MTDGGSFSGDGPVPAAEQWRGPDRYTLRGWVELELALEGGVRVDAAHAVLSDAMMRASGPRLFGWLAEELAAEGRDPQDLAVLLDDDALTERVLNALQDRISGAAAFEPPDAAPTRVVDHRPGVPRGGVSARVAGTQTMINSGYGFTCCSAKARATSTWRMVSSMTSEPWPASNR